MDARIERLFERAAKEENGPLQQLVSELFNGLLRASEDDHPAYNGMRRAVRAAFVRGVVYASKDSLFSYEAQLALVRHIVVALEETRNGEKPLL